MMEQHISQKKRSVLSLVLLLFAIQAYAADFEATHIYQGIPENDSAITVRSLAVVWSLKNTFPASNNTHHQTKPALFPIDLSSTVYLNETRQYGSATDTTSKGMNTYMAFKESIIQYIESNHPPAFAIQPTDQQEALVSGRTTPSAFPQGNSEVVTLHQTSKIEDEGTGHLWHLSTDFNLPPQVPAPSMDETSDLRITSVAPLTFAAGTEKDNTHLRKGRLKQGLNGPGSWIRMIGSRTKSRSGQQGFELGADRHFLSESGRWQLGAYAGYLTPEQNNKRDTNEYSLGAYATYLSDSRWYVHGVLQYGNFNFDLNARSPQGSTIKGYYKPNNGYGLSKKKEYEWQLGNDYWTEPYAKFGYVYEKDPDTISGNEQQTGSRGLDAFHSELGISTGRDFALDSGGVFSPYSIITLTQAVAGNIVTTGKIKRANISRFKEYERFGIGFNFKARGVLRTFGELNYRKKRGMESNASIDAMIGLRYKF